MSTPTRIISAVALVIGLSILAMVVNFVVVQSPSVFRNAFYLGPGSLLFWLPVGVIGAAVFLVATRRSRSAFLAWCLAFLGVACLLWRLIQIPPLANWLLPPPTVK